MRPVNKDWKKEGDILERARQKKKESDSNYTQQYTAAIVGKGQNIWTQWRRGQTRITDVDWVKLGLELGFDPLSTRPELRDMVRSLSKTDGPASEDERTLLAAFRALSETQKRGLLDFLQNRPPD